MVCEKLIFKLLELLAVLVLEVQDFVGKCLDLRFLLIVDLGEPHKLEVSIDLIMTALLGIFPAFFKWKSKPTFF